MHGQIAGLWVVTPWHECDASLAIAAARAGAAGLLDLGLDTPAARRAAELARLRDGAALGAKGPWGVRWDTWNQPDRRPACLGELAEATGRWPLLLIGGLDDDADAMAAALAQSRSLAERVLIECYGPAQAAAADGLGFDGLVIKANEAGGRVANDSAYILLQRLAGKLATPYYLHGALGPQAAAAALLAGASGVVLAEELWLTGEAPFDDATGRAYAQYDGSESADVGPAACKVRLSVRVDRPFVAQAQHRTDDDAAWPAALLERWSTPADAADRPLPLGQGIALAGRLADRGVTVAGVLDLYRDAVDRQWASAPEQPALAPDSPLAQSHGTRYPIVQGPMTRVSDVAPFAKAVADHGALPMLAIALMGGDETAQLLHDTAELLGDRPWGVGILGFVPAKVRQAQMQAIGRHPPRWALIAGGRPAQAREFEQMGTGAYLHVPSAALLKTFLDGGARKFVLEGRECGGHVGPRNSLLLWQHAVDTLLEAELEDPQNIHVLFAGGVHDTLSAAMVEVIARPLAERGIKVGVLMGTAYLFTPEAVATGAISQTYQDQSIACGDTDLLESATGHVTRCTRGPYSQQFQAARRKLIDANASTDEMRLELEMLNVGRLRLAAKGLKRQSTPTPDALPDAGGDERARLQRRGEQLVKGKLVPVDPETMAREGMFMIGQAAVFHEATTPMADLHRRVSEDAVALSRNAPRPRAFGLRDADRPDGPGEPIAIVGMDCVFPGSPDLPSYWQNIVNGFSAIREVSPDRWDPAELYTPDRLSPDRAYCKWGSFLEPQRFDPVRYRIPPRAARQVEPSQLLALELARRALCDAGYDRRPFPRQRTSVIFGTSGIHDVGTAYAVRTMFRHYAGRIQGTSRRAYDEALAQLAPSLPEWSEDSFPGFLPNVIAGRVANRLDLGGTNCVVDAACSSALAALHTGIAGLRNGTMDVALVGAVDWSNNAFTFMSFAKTQALTPAGVSRPFDAGADGILLGEGAGVVVLKRLADAQRDGDRIYATIRGIGSSSDGQARSLTAPYPEGQSLALRRAYADAGVEPRTIALLEAHATGTAVGDRSEIEAATGVFGEGHDGEPYCAVGSVKSMIGHAKSAAGIASLIKTALALHQRTLPPTLNVEQPNPALAAPGSPFYVNTAARPWFHADEHAPRRAAVSAFGFGGTNFHVVLEENADPAEARRAHFSPRPAELFAFAAESRDALRDRMITLRDRLGAGPTPRLAQLARSVVHDLPATRNVRLALIAESLDDLRDKLERAVRALGNDGDFEHPTGIYLSDAQPASAEQVAFLFPGQGAQRVNMLADLMRDWPGGVALCEQAQRWVADLLDWPLHSRIYPPPTFDTEAARAQREAINDTRAAQPAIGLTSLVAIDVLEALGLRPAAVAGHSYGEYVALCAAGVYSRRDLMRVSAKRGQAMYAVGRDKPGAMAAVSADADAVRRAIHELNLDVYLANMNAPQQTVIAGESAAIDLAVERMSATGLTVRRIAVTAAFHSPLVAEAAAKLDHDLEAVDFHEPRLPIYSNASGGPYPTRTGAIRQTMVEHLARPVRFVEQIQAMYDAGSRVFIEAGPGRILTGLTGRILGDQPHAAMSLDHPGQSSWLPLGRLVARCFALGLDVKVATWFAGRGLDTIGVEALLDREQQQGQIKPTDMMLTASRVRPAQEPAEPTPEPRPSESPPPPAAPTPRKTEAIAMSASDQPPQPTPTAPAVPPPAAGQSVDQFQQTMNRWLELQQQFLRLQERVMTGQASGPAPSSQSPAAGAAHPAGPPPAFDDFSSLPTGQAPAIPGMPDASIQASQPAAATDPAPAAPPVPAQAPAPEPAAPRPTDLAATADAGQAPPTAVFKQDLLREVSRCTGYPEDMLELDTPLESGLGIDSIKVIEIFSSLKGYHHLLIDENQDEEEALAAFAELKTLGMIVDQYDRRRGALAAGYTSAPAKPTAPSNGSAAAESTAAPAPGNGTPRLEPQVPEPQMPRPVESGANPKIAAVDDRGATPPPPPAAPVERWVLQPAAAPLDDDAQADFDDARQNIASDRLIVLLGQHDELSGAVLTALDSMGLPAAHLAHGPAAAKVGPHRYEADFDHADSLTQARRLITEHQPQPVAALVNLTGLDPELADDQAELLTTRLLHAARAFEDDFQAAAKRDGGLVVNLTAQGGQFGLGEGASDSLPQAASVGFFKSLAREWRGVRVRNVDLDAHADTQALLAALGRELMADDALEEIGFNDAGRWRIDMAEQPTDATALRADLDARSIVLATGGARGITAHILRRLAERTGATMLIVGRTPLTDAAAEPAGVRDLTDAAALRAALIRRAADAGSRPQPPAIEAAVSRLMRAREVRANLDAIRAAGSAVEYHALDISDAGRFAQWLDAVYDKHGRIDVVIHGAGQLRDGPVHSKTADAVADVFASKVTPALVLARKLRPDSLKHLALFASVAGRFGNAGQSDYAAANECLNALARRLDRAWPGRVVAINWGPWDAGMVSDGLKTAYARRGIELIQPERGAEAFCAELCCNGAAPPQVVLACTARALQQASAPPADRAAGVAAGSGGHG